MTQIIETEKLSSPELTWQLSNTLFCFFFAQGNEKEMLVRGLMGSQSAGAGEETLIHILISKLRRHQHRPTAYLFVDAGLFFRLLRVLRYKDSKIKKSNINSTEATAKTGSYP